MGGWAFQAYRSTSSFLEQVIELRAVIQRVSQCSVRVSGREVGRIGAGLLIYLGVGRSDTTEDARLMAEKIANLRIFQDENGKMNLSVLDTGGEALVVSQFTLFGDARGGRRPSYSEAAPPQEAKPLYERVIQELAAVLHVETGEFQAMMEVSYTNEGPITILMDTEKRF